MKFKLNFYLLAFLGLVAITNQITINMDDKYCEDYVLFNIEKEDTVYKARWIKDIRDADKENEEYFQLDPKTYVFRTTAFYTIKQSQETRVFTNSLEVTFNNEDDNSKITFVTQVKLDNTVKDKATTVQSLIDSISAPGTSGTVAYEENGNLVIILRSKEISLNSSFFVENTTPAVGKTIVKKDYYWFNCLITDKDDLQDYFINRISYNYAFWLFVFFYFGYFLVAVFLHEKMDPLDYKENVWTYHPIYSIRYFVTPIFTKRLRLTNLYIEITSIAFLLAWFTQLYNDESLAIRLTVIPLSACIFGIFPTYIGGFLITNYYNGYRTYVAAVKRSESMDQKMGALEVFEKSCFRREYMYYCYAALVGFGSNVGSIFFMNNQLEVQYGWWILSITISLVMNYCIFDILVVMLAKGNILTGLFKKRAFWIDVKLQDDYTEVAGED